MNSDTRVLMPADYWHAMPGGQVACELCPHHCHIREGRTGLCRVRMNRGGQLKAAAYGLVASAHVDPIEKKPLYHFHPGAPVYSVGGWGCNFSCTFCQNWSLSQDFRPEGSRSAPGEIVAAMRAAACGLVAYTYNEPLVGFEFVRDSCREVRKAGGRNVLVTNGFVEEAPAAELLPLIDALNIDIKSMDDTFYRSQCGGSLGPVLAFCRRAVQAGCHVEITHLVIPALNDQDGQFDRLAGWIADELGAGIPLHLSAYHPDYRLASPATPRATLLRAHQRCRQRLTYVYIGNVLVDGGQDTACPGCGSVLIHREGYAVSTAGLTAGACSRCGRQADLIL